MNPVPCNGCVRCCTGKANRVLDERGQFKYQVEPHPREIDTWMLASKPDGSCVYLNETGCSIHFDKPKMCREFDCRILARKLSYTGARKARIISIWKKGEELNHAKN